MPEKILIVDDDVDTLRLVGLMLQRQGYHILAASNGQQGLDLAFAEIPDLILLDVMMPQIDGYEVARRLRSNASTADIPILMFTAKTQLDDKVTGFEAGADDYLTKPTHPTELQAHVKALLARSSKNTKGGINPPTGPVENPGYVIGVLAARGGLGVTNVALNVASALYDQTKGDTLLMETRLGQGTLAFDLNLPTTKALIDLLNTPAQEITREKIREHIASHPSGLRFLVASTQPKDAALTPIPQYEMIVKRLSVMARFVILDLGAGLTAVNQKLIPMCNELIVVVEPLSTSVAHSKALIDDLAALGVERRKITTTINYRVRFDLQLSVNQVQEKLGHSIAVTFTPAPELILQSARQQTSAYFGQKDTLTRQQYATLASKIEEKTPKPKTP
jgi:DNA-binding response OmpR family regulator